MFKYILLLILLYFNVYANMVTDDKNATIENIIKDKKLTNTTKLYEIQKYLKNLELNNLNDDFNNSKDYKFNIMGYHDTYFLITGYSNNLIERHWINGVEDTNKNGYKRDKKEAQFQFSLKMPLYQNFLNTNGDLFAAYTQNSYWQVYDQKHSSPFRETNYMPELFLQWNLEQKVYVSTLKTIRLSLVHQSNGQDVGQSRSWNRTELALLFHKNKFSYGFNLWNRWDEDKKTDPTSTKGDDNPDLEDYIGTGKYYIRYKTDKVGLTFAHQNNLLKYDINKGNNKLDIIFPSVNRNFDFFFRYFYGYGESLIDYDVKVKRISFGIMIAKGVI